MIQYYGTGRRKTSIARVYLRPGNGKIDVVVNHKRRELDAYFTLEYWKSVIKKPLLTTETVDKFDVIVFLTGGGISAQADAVRLGLARALQSYNPEL
ncbi:MAG TPA: 30S ribosomal protein S9, partial [Candidatus Aminicenantes bacterium]|nr:30S ribosomal protein S9 [Candidatus Aminicenantes bacterium]